MMDEIGPIKATMETGTAEHVEFLEQRLAEQEEKTKNLEKCILVLRDRASGLTNDDVAVLSLLGRL